MLFICSPVPLNLFCYCVCSPLDKVSLLYLRAHLPHDTTIILQQVSEQNRAFTCCCFFLHVKRERLISAALPWTICAIWLAQQGLAAFGTNGVPEVPELSYSQRWAPQNGWGECKIICFPFYPVLVDFEISFYPVQIQKICRFWEQLQGDPYVSAAPQTSIPKLQTHLGVRTPPKSPTPTSACSSKK
jgi:hypothetical protein